MNDGIRNAIITSAKITTEEGFLTALIDVCYGGGLYQGIGAYVLHLPKSNKHFTIKSVAGHFIYRMMDVAGVTDWNSIVGKPVRVVVENERIHIIGHIIDDNWFCPKKEFAEDEE